VFDWVDHTAELELAIEAPSERRVFADALAALGELLAGERPCEPEERAERGPEVRRHISVEAQDRPALLAAWMEELVFLAETDGFEPVAVETLELRPSSAQATVRGRLGRPPPLVKAITYHGLSFAPSGDGYRATVVLDV
jgi:SHS2 domain-containing protein